MSSPLVPLSKGAFSHSFPPKGKPFKKGKKAPKDFASILAQCMKKKS